MAIQFHDLLRQLVEQYESAHPGTTRESIAKNCGFQNGSRLSQYMSRRKASRRSPRSRDTVINIANGLNLDVEKRNALLDAARYPRDGALEQMLEIEPVRELHLALEDDALHLPSPEREALKETLISEARILVGVWRSFFDLRQQLYARHWPEVEARINEQLDDQQLDNQQLKEGYWALRQMAARHRVRLALLAAAAQHHVGAYDAAIQAIAIALEAAQEANAPMLLCQCHVRRGDIQRSRGRYDDARKDYQKAFDTLENWQTITEVDKVWAKHWRARTRRKMAALSLFQGRPHDAIPILKECIAYFNSDYEQSRCFFTLGWAQTHTGDWQAASESYETGLALTEKLKETRGQDDPRQLVEAYLGLAGIHVQRGELAQATDRLDEAQAWLLGEWEATWRGRWYHEVGRYWLLQGRLYASRGGPDAIDHARAAYDKGIRFHLNEDRKDPSRLASLYNALGILELRAENRLAARKQFRETLRWANESIPPNQYYTADVLVYICALELGHEEVSRKRDEMIAAAREACVKSRYWRKLALLEQYCAEDAARRANLDGVAMHAARALSSAIQFNLDTARATADHLKKVIHELCSSEAEHADLVANIVKQLTSSDLNLTKAQSRELATVMTMFKPRGPALSEAQGKLGAAKP